MFQIAYIRGYWDIQWFAEFFLRNYFTSEPSEMHFDLFEELEDGNSDRGRRKVIAAPRGHAKTTIMVTLQVIHAICYGYEPFIIIMAQNMRESEERVAQILDELRHNQEILNIYGLLAPPKGLGGQKGFVTRNDVCIKAVSWGQSIRGMKHKNHRPSLIILDDVETLEGVQNPEQRDKRLEKFQKDILNAGNVDGYLNVTVIGTCLHDEGLINHLLNKPNWHGKRYQAVTSFATNQDLWNQWQSIITDLTNSNREVDANIFLENNREAMMAGVKVLWKSDSYESLMKMRVFEGNAAFQSEKQNEPYDPDRQLFNPEDFHYFTWNEDSKAMTMVKSERTVCLEALHTINAYWDPCVGESDNGDYAAVIVGGKDTHGHIYILDTYIARGKPEQQIQAIEALYKKWGFGLIGVETNGFQAVLARDIQQRLAQIDDGCRVLRDPSSSNKEMRIAALEPKITNGHILFSTNIHPLLKDQLKYFPSASHDDGPDALAGLVKSLDHRQDPAAPKRPKRKNISRRRGTRYD